MTEVSTDVGRIVWGNPAVAQQKRDPKTKAVILGNDGQPIVQWAWGVAFPKQQFQQLIWPTMAAEAAKGYPNGTPQKFAWKYNDGDGIDGDGKPFNTREGYAGCYVLTVSTQAFAPPIWKRENGVYRQIDPKEIKTGDYIAMTLDINLHVPTDRTHTPSLYINPKGIELVGFGKEIVTTADPNAMFGGRTYQLPPEASQTPVYSAGTVGMPGTGGGGMPGQMPGGMQQQQPMQPVQQQPMQPVQQQPMQPVQQYQQPMQPVQQYQQPQPGQMPMPGGMPQQPMQQQLPPPATDFIPGQQPMQPMPGGMPQQQPVQQFQQPMQQPQPGQMPMPGMMPGN